MKRCDRLLAVAALTMAACGYLAGPAQAQTGLTTVQMRVSSAGLDLTTDEGADAMLKRLSRAATNVCGQYPDAGPLVFDGKRRFQACRARALAGAVATSRSATLKRQFAATREADILRLAAK